MKKYFQIVFFLGAFFLVVVFKNLIKGDNGTQPIVGNPLSAPSQNVPSGQSNSGQAQPQSQQSGTAYKDGTYTGSVEDAFYGNVQVQAVITNGKITDVVFLQYPNENRTSQFINSQAIPILKSEAIQAQSAQVDIVSGASATSPAFQRSLSTALSKAS